MFTRANFDIRGTPLCREANCDHCASYFITNTIIKDDSITSFSYAYCTEHFNKIEDDENDE